MYISNLKITNYRGVKETRSINLARFSSVVGKNDAGKTIVLNAIATFLDIKSFTITQTDFNYLIKPIEFEFQLCSDSISDLLETKVKSKVKKTEGLDEFINDLIFDNSIIYKRIAYNIGKSWSEEHILINDFENSEIQGLYFKSDEEITAIVEKFGIVIPVDGKGRNSKAEKIKFIKEHFKDEPRANFWIPDDMKISSLFPEVEMFKADYGLEADTKFKTATVTEIEEYFNLAEARLQIFKDEINTEMKKEADILKFYMQEYASNLLDIDISPNVAWKDAIKSVDVSFQFTGDDKFIPMTHKGTGYRRLFMVARFRYLAQKSKGNNIIYLIEEPETFLHPTAQQDLLNALKELSNDNQVITTTHSPVFAGATHIEGVVLCTKDTQSNYENTVSGNERDFLFKIIDELGIKPSFNLRDNHESILFVESTNDMKFYDIICRKLLDFNLIGNPKILVLPFGGGTDIDSFLNIDYFDNSGRKLFLLIDSDKQQNKQDEQNHKAQDYINRKENAHAYVVFRSCIENYYHPRCIERVYECEGGTFPDFQPEDNVRTIIKNVIAEKELGNKNIKEKNNFKVFENMTDEEWQEVVEEELLDFLVLLK
ncbi:AAA family ATPase [Chryseobacterium sp. MFBS3-17]|uniref:AAA family ATPase n=1 Tax=Chryseobacterium sp. MFBS3-17 TaxID=2886689 RepID=UPI001D0F1EB2|nr:AAA family ATPase [Chryseobacterium sp. MFBS3-17]MCC2589357.1 ATP-binding protein [Chryseobacterium sp. MFBS3-17]